MKFRTAQLPNARVWLRVVKPDWSDPLDPGFARVRGGRWNPPTSYPTLYCSADVTTARLQVERMLDGSPVTLDDLRDDAYGLIAFTLPNAQRCADAVGDEGLQSCGLPPSYPRDAQGVGIGHSVCQLIGAKIHALGLRGVWCRSACTNDGSGREVAWFPATNRSKAKALWDRPLPLRQWRYAVGWSDLDLDEQPDPKPHDAM